MAVAPPRADPQVFRGQGGEVADRTHRFVGPDSLGLGTNVSRGQGRGLPTLELDPWKQPALGAAAGNQPTPPPAVAAATAPAPAPSSAEQQLQHMVETVRRYRTAALQTRMPFPVLTWH